MQQKKKDPPPRPAPVPAKPSHRDLRAERIFDAILAHCVAQDAPEITASRARALSLDMLEAPAKKKFF
jgi:hypothetical protein